MNSDLRDLRAYVEAVTGGASWRAIAVAIGIEPSTITRQFSRGRVPASTIVAIARAYQGDVLEGLVAGDVITVLEAEEISRRGGLRDASDLELAKELLRRASRAARESALARLSTPVRPVVSGFQPAVDATQPFESDAAAHTDVAVTPEAESQTEEP